MNRELKKVVNEYQSENKSSYHAFHKILHPLACWDSFLGPNVEMYRQPFSYSIWLTSSSLSASVSEWSRGKLRYCDGRNQSNLSLNSFEPATLHIRFPFCLCWNNCLFPICAHTCASPTVSTHSQKSVCLLFHSASVSNMPCKQASALIYRKPVRKGVDMWMRVGTAAVHEEKSKLKLHRCNQKRVLGENKETPHACLHRRL